MKQGINSRRTGNLLSRAGNLLRLTGNCPPGESPFFIADGNGLILSCIAPDAAPGLHVTEAASLRVAVLAKKAGAILMRRRAVLTDHRCGTFWKPLTCSKGLS